MAGVNALTDLGIKAVLRAGKTAEKPKRLSDGDGLHLVVRPGGSAWWRLGYRFDGKEQMLSLGTYPEVLLVLARERRDAARRMIAAGTDPSQARKAEKAARQQQQAEPELAAGQPGPGSFEVVAREWLTTIHEAKVSPGHAERTRICFEQDAFPSLITGERPMNDNTINLALRRTGFDRETATAHGFRAMARTMAVERLGIEPEVIEAQLAHAKSGPLGGAYV